MPNEPVVLVSQPSKTRLYVLSFILFLTIVSALGVFFFDPVVWKGLGKPTPTPVIEAIEPTPSEPRIQTILPKGTQTYTFSHGDKVVGPKPSIVTIDPLSTTLNEKQSITITISDSSPVTSASVFLTTDMKQDGEHILTKKTTPDNKDIWTGSWTVEDTTDNRYELRLYIQNATGVYNNTMRFR